MLKRANKFFQTRVLIWIGRRWLVVSLRTAALIAVVLVAFGWLLGKVLG